ncbi:MAG: DUF4867 family protein [Butyrivibrio sp.]|nr:DUF4867 family protein [Butyrivibrio sp.]
MGDTLAKVNMANDVRILPVADTEFKTYGRVLTGYNFDNLIKYMEERTQIPAEGNVYVPSVATMEIDPVTTQVKGALYGGMDIQIGYCNGRNTAYNGFEYHKGSEINVAVTDFMLVLGHTWDMKVDNNDSYSYHVDKAQVFYVPQGCAIEIYQTTLHLSPCRVNDEGFKDIVILPRGTNTPFPEKEQTSDPESKILLMRNKWIVAHPDNIGLMADGAYPGVIGENKELKYY